MSWFNRKAPQKPDPEGEYRIGYACENVHVQNVQGYPNYNQIAPVLGKSEVCLMCGDVAYPAVIRRTYAQRAVGFFTRTWETDYSYDLKTDKAVRYLDKERA